MFVNIYMMVHNLHDCAFEKCFKVKNAKPIKTRLHMVCIKPDSGIYLPELIFLEQHSCFVFYHKTSSKVCSAYEVRKLESTDDVTILYNDVIVYDRCWQCLCCNFPYFKRAGDG